MSFTAGCGVPDEVLTADDPRVNDFDIVLADVESTADKENEPLILEQPLMVAHPCRQHRSVHTPHDRSKLPR